MKATKALIDKLLERIHLTETLKSVSDNLEQLAQNKAFKNHANFIISDDSLTDAQKNRQLLFLIQTIDTPLLQEFFSDLLGKNTYWVFTSDKIDYFDKFVQEFQMATEELGILHLTTAIKLSPVDLRAIALDLSKSFGYKVLLSYEVNPSIMGGAQIRVENMIYDYSLRSKFQQFQRQWLSSINTTEKQIGRHQPD